MKSKYFISALVLGSTLAACDDVLEPAAENTMDITAIYTNPSMAMGLLGNAYVLLPYGGTPDTDLATDDAVCNDLDNNYSKMAAGGWTSNSNPVSRWQGCYHAIQYINLLLENTDNVEYASSEALRIMHNDVIKGQCYAMRGMFHYYLLQNHAGYVGGTLMGVQYHYASEGFSSNYNNPRLTYVETLKCIEEDLAKALELLPDHFGSIKSADAIPEKYKQIGATQADYNRAFGDNHKGKVDGIIVKAIRAQLLLMSASPAFEASGVTNAQAAKALAEVLKAAIGGLDGLDPEGHKWFCNYAQINKLASDQNPAEVLWRSGNNENSHSIEDDNFPPSLFGNGRTNPTQNLVDAFPMANGYPITDAASGYDASKPYEGRDPRFYDAIIYNGATQGVDNTAIDVTTTSSTLDGINKENKKSTRTGYYMKKLTRSDVNINPNSTTGQRHYTPRIRFTELFLDYAEAANEAYGPTGIGDMGSAYDVIKAIRHRALGIDDDPYLESIKNDKDAMRQLIRNERRLELCFENKRFWDLRRWKVDLNELNTTAKGVSITGTNYKVIDVDTRNYKDYMYYGPIPYGEIQKFSELQQNDGWQ
ncbi:MAG: RagB/SusD family nutrient uptake outer membrane protein [Marinilabiliaceae bacterium]|nr:RagB/SusD family nutrient uptake outer membrane protein [Marinilabiliaceae bacterium]